jgi:thiol:disulfide interchange protein DsbD
MTPQCLRRFAFLALAMLSLLGLGGAGALAASPDATSSSGASSALSNSGDNFLSPSQAFQLSGAAAADGGLDLSWIIAPGYYLYRDRIHIAAAATGLTLAAPQFPAGHVKDDPYFGKQVIYHQLLTVHVPVSSTAGARSAAVRVTYQGCAEAGLCYPPITHTLSISLPAGGSGNSAGAAAGTASAAGTAAVATGGYVSEQDRLAGEIRSGNLAAVLAVFWALGLGLAFTPCCLPMVPILSGLIAGGGQRLSSARAFALSLTYVLGMAITYTVTGAAFAAAGSQVQAAFQQPWIIALFAGLFVAMSLSMFGLYTVQVPSFLQTRLATASNRQQGGHFGGVAVMGALSALIVTTCVAPPLVAVLAVIGQSGAIARGSAALFAMAIGMGCPLLVVGTSAGRWLPKAGAWMDGVKRLFGVMMLALAAWMLMRVVPARATLALFVIPALAGCVVLAGLARTRTARGPLRVGALLSSAAAATYALMLLVGTGLGAENPLAPLSRPATELAFRSVSSVAQLDREVQLASAQGQPVMLDFYADWCTSCKEMQHYTFTDPSVREALRHVLLLRADVTANDQDDQALLHRFQIFGPPTIAFYDPRGHEQPQYRVVGYMNAPRFTALLQRALIAARAQSAG